MRPTSSIWAGATSSRWPSRGALKMKEVSYIHAEGYPAAEMKHGPIALIDENMPVVVLAPRDAVYAKTLSNIEEVRARHGRVIAVVNDENDEVTRPRRRAHRRSVHDSGAHARSGHRAAPAAGLSCGGAPRLRRGPAAQPGQIGDGRMRVVLQRVSEASGAHRGRDGGRDRAGACGAGGVSQRGRRRHRDVDGGEAGESAHLRRRAGAHETGLCSTWVARRWS